VTGTLGLHSVSLSDILQLLATSQRSGTLFVHHPLSKASIYFAEGKLIHAQFKAFIGEEAILALFQDEQGNFEFVAGEVTVDKSISKSLDVLLMKAILEQQKSKNSQTALDMTALAIPSFADSDTSQSKLTLSPQEVATLRLIDGQRTVQTIAIEVGLSLNDTKQIVGRLVDIGLLQVRDQDIRTARLVIRLSPIRLAVGYAGIDRKILRAREKSLKEPITQVKCRRENKEVLFLKTTSVEAAGPYIYLSQDIMLRHNLRAEAPLLVKPYKETVR